MESAQFVERYELRAASDQEDLMLRRLFSPSVVSWLANHPLTPGFELKAGTLCVFVPFSIYYMQQPVRLDFLWAGLCMCGAVFFMFRGLPMTG